MEDYPALHVGNNGTISWCINGVHHREDGPAIIWPNGSEWWFLFDQRISKEKLEQIIYSD